MRNPLRARIKLQCPILYRGRYLPSIDADESWYNSIEAMLREIGHLASGFKINGWDPEHLPSVYHIEKIDHTLSVDID